MAQNDELLYAVEEGVATVTINRPEARNAMNTAVNAALYEAWERIDRSPEVRAVVLASADCGTFCAGMDLKETARMKAETGEDILRFMKDPFQARMRRVRVPIVAAMAGHVMAGGMMLALNCDLRVGLAGSRIGITESRIGRGSPWGMPLVWMLPQPVLMEMVLTAELLPIERLRELGFVNYVEPDAAAVRARALALARTIRDNAPLSVACGKQAILAAMSTGCDAALELAWKLYRPAYESEDAQEGARAFAEKRKPVWTGR